MYNQKALYQNLNVVFPRFVIGKEHISSISSAAICRPILGHRILGSVSKIIYTKPSADEYKMKDTD